VIDLERKRYVWIDAWSDKPMLHDTRELAREIAREEREEGERVAIGKVTIEPSS
jgi:hypothetical protein